MPNLSSSNSLPHRYLEDARQQALDSPGHEQIVRTPQGYQVQPLNLESQTHLLNPIGLETKAVQDELQTIYSAQGTAQNTVEFIFDDLGDGALTRDTRFEVVNGQVKAHEHRLTHQSSLLRSPENNGLRLVREVMQRGDKALLLNLTPQMVSAVLSSSQLTAEEQAFVDQYFNNDYFQTANRIFTQFMGEEANYAQAGVKTFDALLERLNQPQHQANLNTLYQLGASPERFQTDLAEQEQMLTSMADTFKVLPGFKRFPQSQLVKLPATNQREAQREFSAALRTIDQYQYKFRLSHGMQFNQAGLSGYETELGYRWGNKTINIGVAGRDYDFANPFDDQNQAHGLNQLRVEYRTPNFDLRTGVERDQDGGFDIISPRSDWADRFIDDKLEQGKGWAEENPWQAALIGAGVVAGIWGYSYATGQDISVDFNQRFDLVNAEHFRLRGEISPEVHLNGGQPDLGLHSVGLGAMGHRGDISYNATLRHRFSDTTLGSGQIHNQETDLNTRLSYRSYSFETANRWEHQGDKRLMSELALAKNFTLSESSSAYLRPAVVLHDGQYEDIGIRGGWSKDFNQRVRLEINSGYSEKQGASAGFRTTFQF